jgi:hypothetical protein
MLRDAIFSILRHVLTAVGGVLAAKGVIDGGAVEPLIGAILTIAGFGWGVYDKRSREAEIVDAAKTARAAVDAVPSDSLRDDDGHRR